MGMRAWAVREATGGLSSALANGMLSRFFAGVEAFATFETEVKVWGWCHRGGLIEMSGGRCLTGGVIHSRKGHCFQESLEFVVSVVFGVAFCTSRVVDVDEIELGAFTGSKEKRASFVIGVTLIDGVDSFEGTLLSDEVGNDFAKLNSGTDVCEAAFYLFFQFDDVVGNAANDMVFNCKNCCDEFSMVKRHNVVDLGKVLGGCHEYAPSLEVDELVAGE